MRRTVLLRQASSLALILSALAPALHAAEPADTANSTIVLGNVVVNGGESGPMPSSSVVSSVDILSSDMIEHRNVRNSWELYNQLPGVQLTEFKMGAWSGKPSFRGFNGEGEINAVKLLIDGVPSNSNDGNMPYLDMIFPMDIDSVEVVRGTNDARYGLHNIAGNTNIITKTGGNYSQGRVSYGTLDSRNLQAAQGFDNGTVSQNYFVALDDSKGYREHDDSRQYSLAGKWFYTPNSGDSRIGLIARTYRIKADEAGYLTTQEENQSRTQSMARNATDGGDRALSQISGHLDMDLTDRLSWSVKTYSNNYDDERWVTYAPVDSQQERIAQEHHVGALSSMTWRPDGVPVVHSLAFEGGVSFEHQSNESLRYLTRNRVRTAMTRNQQYDLDVSGTYVQAVVEPISSLKLIPAMRVDSLSGNLTNRLNGQTYGINDYGLINQPKFSMIYTPIKDYSLYANWGRTYQVGVGAATYKAGQSDDLKPSINNGWETGVKFRPLSWLDGRVALWQQVASNEARRKLNDPDNASENIGKTRRDGVDLELSTTPWQGGRLWAGYSWQESEILKADTSTPASLGKEIDHVPHNIYSAGVDHMLTDDIKLSLMMHGQSSYFLERTNSTNKYGAYTLFDLGASYQLNENVNVDFQVKNLTDAKSEYVWIENTEVLHAPGDGINAFLGVTVKM